MSSPSSHRFSDPFRNWLRRSDVPEKVTQPLEPRAQTVEVRPFNLPADSDVQEGAMHVSLLRTPQAKPLGDYTPDGTYIPLSGGQRGWFDNSGVLKSEADNRYRFREAVDADSFKHKILERIETFNRRDSDRYQVELWVRHSDPAHPDLSVTHRAYCMDLSLRGAKLRVRTDIPAGEVIAVSFFQQKVDADEGTPLATALAAVQHNHPAGGAPDNPRFYLGIEFVDLDIATKETIATLMSSGTALVPRK